MSWVRAHLPKTFRRASVEHEVSSRLNGSRNVSSPKSSNPVWRRAAATRVSVLQRLLHQPGFFQKVERPA